MPKTTNKKIDQFLIELSEVCNKHNILIESTDELFLIDDSGDIGSIIYDYDKGQYIKPKTK